MIDNKKIYNKKWNSQAVQYLEKSFLNRYISFLITKLLTSSMQYIYIYIILQILVVELA